MREINGTVREVLRLEAIKDQNLIGSIRYYSLRKPHSQTGLSLHACVPERAYIHADHRSAVQYDQSVIVRQARTDLARTHFAL